MPRYLEHSLTANVGLATLREATLDDYSDIAALESRHGFKTRSYDAWRRFWIGNPVYEQCQCGWALAWVLENSSGEIVGSITNIPLRYTLQGRDLLVAAGRAWVTDEAYRTCALQLLDQFFSQRGVDLFLCTTANSKAEAGITAVGARRVPVGAWNKAGFWITDHRGFANSLVATERLPRTLTLPVAAALSIKDRVKKTAILHDAAAHQVGTCLHFDSRFDEFWEQLKSRKSQCLLGERTGKVLEWHFRHALDRGTIWIATITERTRIAAYGIFCRKDNQKIGLKRVRLVDFQSLDGVVSPLRSILAWAYARCQDERISILENIGWCLEKAGVMERFSPYRRLLPSWQYFYKLGNPALPMSVHNAATWDASLFDGDASL